MTHLKPPVAQGNTTLIAPWPAARLAVRRPGAASPPVIPASPGGPPLALHFLLFLHQTRDRDELVLALDIDEPDALRGPADRPHVVGLHAENHALLGDEQQLVAILDERHPDDQAISRRRGDVDDPDPAARLHPVFVDFRPLAEPALGDGEERSARF